ncbi:hypothetical protein WDW89_16365 [Deltaproteobacteria bacterium TL4]
MAEYCTFPIPMELYVKVQEISEQINNSTNKMQHTPAFVALLLEQVDIGVDYYFLRIPSELEVGRIGMKVVNLGIKTMKGAMHMIINKLLHNLTESQLERLVLLEQEMLLQSDEQ